MYCKLDWCVCERERAMMCFRVGDDEATDKTHDRSGSTRHPPETRANIQGNSADIRSDSVTVAHHRRPSTTRTYFVAG